MEEIIKPIPGHDKYFVSNLGIVYSDKRKERKALKPYYNTKGTERLAEKDGHYHTQINKVIGRKLSYHGYYWVRASEYEKGF